MIKPIIQEIDLTRTNDFIMDRIEIVIDDQYPDKVELYIVDGNGDRLEGGTFDRGSFMQHIMDFYQKNY